MSEYEKSPPQSQDNSLEKKQVEKHFVDFEMNLPEYFSDPRGIETLNKLRELIENLAKAKNFIEVEECLRDAIKETDKSFLYKSDKFSNRVEGQLFHQALKSSDTIKFTIAEPDFENFYWAPEDRYKTVSFLIGFFNQGNCLGVRIIAVNNNGEIGRISDLGMDKKVESAQDFKLGKYDNALKQAGIMPKSFNKLLDKTKK